MDKGKAVIVGLTVGFLLWPRKGKAMDLQLSEHFMRSEFLRSATVPQIAEYEPTAKENENLARHANYLEVIRGSYGPILVTGGLRPESFRASFYVDRTGQRHEAPEGISMTDALLAVGYPASRTSDHIPGFASDIKFLKIHQTKSYVEAYNLIKGLPGTRQVILYLTRGQDGSLFAGHLHVANVGPGHPIEERENYAWVEVDGARVTTPVVDNV